MSSMSFDVIRENALFKVRSPFLSPGILFEIAAAVIPMTTAMNIICNRFDSRNGEIILFGMIPIIVSFIENWALPPAAIVLAAALLTMLLSDGSPIWNRLYVPSPTKNAIIDVIRYIPTIFNAILPSSFRSPKSAILDATEQNTRGPTISFSAFINNVYTGEKTLSEIAPDTSTGKACFRIIPTSIYKGSIRGSPDIQ